MGLYFSQGPLYDFAQALHKIALEHPHSVVREGGLEAVLKYLEFFHMGVQRQAVTTAANMCRGATADCFDQIQVSPFPEGLHVPVTSNAKFLPTFGISEEIHCCF